MWNFPEYLEECCRRKEIEDYKNIYIATLLRLVAQPMVKEQLPNYIDTYNKFNDEYKEPENPEVSLQRIINKVNGGKKDECV